MAIQIEVDTQKRTDSATDTSQVPQRPEHIPEKFWDAEKGQVNLDALLKAQRDAEVELNRLRNELNKVQPSKANTQDETKGADRPSASTTIAELREAATKEFLERGELSDETYAKFEAVGIDRATVDAVIEGSQAKQRAQQEKLFKTAGTDRATFEKAADWASKNLTAAEISALNEELEDPITAAAAIRKLVDRYTKEASKEGKVISGDHVDVAPTGEYYKNMDEMMAVVRSEAYKKGDPKVHEEHRRKLINSEKMGIDLFSRV